MRRAGLIVALLAGVVSACVDDPQEIGPEDIVRLLMSNDSIEIKLGDTLRLNGMALDASGAVVSGAQLDWGVDRPDVLQVDATNGTAIALAEGLAVVSARYRQMTAEARVFVQRGPILELSADTAAFTGKAGGADPAEDTLQVTNGGGFSVSGLTVDSVGYADSAVAGWLTAAIDSSNTPTILRLSAAIAGLTVPGVYGAIVRVTSANADSSPQTVGVSLRITAGDPATLAANAGDTQTAVVGQTVGTAPSVRIRDQFGNPVPGIPVSFTVISGGGSAPVPPVEGGYINGSAAMMADTVQTDGAGIATVTSWTLGPTVGPNVLEAAIVGDTIISAVTFTAAGTPAPAAQIAATQGGGQTTTVGTAVGLPPQVHVQDQFGNDVPGASVTFSVNAGNGVIVGANATTDAAGLAGLASWTLDTLIGPDTVFAQVAGVADTVRFVSTGTADAATDIVLLVGDGQVDSVGATLPVNPTVRVTDQYGNPVAGVSVGFAVTSGGGSVGAATVATAASGQAGTSWTLGTTPGIQTLSATGAGLNGSPVAFTATASAGAASQIAKSQGDSVTTTVGATVSPAPTVLITDAVGNAVPGVQVVFTIQAGGGAVTGDTVTTNASGQAAVGSWTLGTMPGANALLADAGGSLQATFTATATAAAADTLFVVQGQGTNATVGTAVGTVPTVRVTDAFGNPVSGQTVTFVVTGGGGNVTDGTTATDGAGNAAPTAWTLGTAAGSNTLQAAAAGLNGSPIVFTATGTADAADSIAIVQGNNQSATVGTAVATAPRVRVLDQYSNVVPGVQVVFAVTGGGGSLTGDTVVTNASGNATLGSWTLGTAAGANTMTATAAGAGITDNPRTFTATATSGAAANVAFTAGTGQSATVGTAVATPPAATVTDQFGNPVSGVQVVFSATLGGGGVTGGTVNTNASGVATVGAWTLGTIAGLNTLQAAVTGLTPATVNATGLRGAATAVVFTTEPPAAAITGDLFTTQPAAALVDQYGNAVDSAGATVTASLVGAATLDGTPVQVTGGSGTVSWTDLGITGTPGAYRLAIAATGLMRDTSGTILLAGGPPDTLFVVQGDGQNATVGTAVATVPVVRVTDSLGNPSAGVEVTFAVTGGGGALGVLTDFTDVNGDASPGSWTLGTTPVVNTFTAASAGLSGSPVTFTATALVGAADTIFVAAGQGQTAPVGTGVPVLPSVTVTDALGNPVNGVSVTFTVTGGGGSRTGGSTTTNASGVATVGSWTLGTVAGANTMTAVSAGLAGSPVTFTATGAHGAATRIVVTTEPSANVQSGATLAQQPITGLVDQFGNVVDSAGITITASLIGGAGTLGGTVAQLTAGSGAATWTDLGITSATGTRRIRFAGTGLTPDTSLVITVGTGAATTIAISAGNAQIDTVGQAVPIAPAVLVTDAGGNPVSGVGVTFAITSGGGGITGATPTTNGSGIATLGSWTLDSVPGANSLSATSGSLAGSPLAFTATGVVDAPDSVFAVAGTGQSATAGSPVATPPAVRVNDQYGNAVPGASVTFAVTGGAGSVNPVTAVLTDAGGVAAATSWTMGVTPAVNTLDATVGAAGVADNPVTFTANGVTGGDGALSITTEPSAAATAGTALAQQPVIQLLNPVLAVDPTPGVSVSVALASGAGGSLQGTLVAVTNGGGVATFTDLRIDGAVGAYTLAFSATDRSGAVSTTVTVSAAAADTVFASAGTGQAAPVGTTVATPPAVTVTDEFGNPISGESVTFAVTGGGGVVDPVTAIVTGLDGVAQVTNWTLGNGAGPNTLTATRAGLGGSPVTFTATGTAGAPATVTVDDGNNQVTTVDAAVPVPPSVLVVDGFTNPVPGVEVVFAVTGGGGAVTGGTDTTDASGIATVGSWTMGVMPGANSLDATVSAGGVTGNPVTFNATATVAAADTIFVVSGTGQSDTVAATITSPVVRVTDFYGNPVQGVNVTFTASGDGQVTDGAAVTDVNGDASPTSWQLSTSVGTDTLYATSGVLNGSPVRIAADVTVGTADTIFLVSGAGQSDTVRAMLTAPVVRVTDVFGNPVTGVGITFTVSGDGQVTGATPATDANGDASPATWMLGSTADTDSDTLTATSAGLSGSPLRVVATATPGVATTMALDQGSPQTATVGTPVATLPRVLVTDQFGNGRSGITVNFAATGDGSVGDASDVTDGDGYADPTSWTLGTTPGVESDTLTATSAGLAGSPLQFLGTATVGAADTIFLVSGAGQVDTVEAALTVPVVRVTDEFGNPVSGVAVTFTASGDGQVTGGATATDVNGDASPTTWNLGTTAAGQSDTLFAASTGLGGSPLAIVATATAGAADTLFLVSGAGQSDTARAFLATPVVVRVTDRNGNPITGVSVTFTASGSGNVTGGNPTTDGFGEASPTTWQLGTTAATESDTLTATSTGLGGSPLPIVATATAAAATTILANSITSQSATVNTFVATAPSVLVEDQYGNPVSGVEVTFAVTGGGGSVTGGTQNTDALGVATVTTWRVGTTAGTNNNTLTATSGGLTGSPVGFTASANPGGPSPSLSTVASNVGSFTATASNNAATITVTARDQFSNLIPGATVVLAVDGTGNSIVQPASVTNGSGVATGTFGSTVAQGKIVSATIDAVGITNTASVTVNPGAATAGNSLVTTNLGTIPASSGSSPVTVTVTARDQFNNGVSGQTAAISVSPTTGNTVTQPVGTTNSAGQITGSFYSTRAELKTVTATLNSGAISITDDADVTVTAAAVSAANSSVNQGTGTITASSGGTFSTITVTAQDQFNNPVSGAAVILGSNQGGASFTAAGSTNGSGVATSNFSATNAALHTITATAGGVAITDNAMVTVNPDIANAAQTLISVDDNSILAANSAASGTANYRSVVTVTVRDQFGNNRQGDIVTFTPSDANDFWRISTVNATVSNVDTTDAAGEAQRVFYSTFAQGKTLFGTGTNISENIGVTVSPAGYSTAVSTMNATEPITASTGGAPSTVTGLVRDVYGNGIPNRRVIVVASGVGGVGYPTTRQDTTSASGSYSVQWYASGMGNATVQMYVYNDPDIDPEGNFGYMTSTDVVFVDHASPSTLFVYTGSNNTGRVGTAVSTLPQFELNDAYGNAVDGFTVNFGLPTGGGSRSPSSDVTDANGRVQISSWTLGGTAGVYTSGTYAGHMLNEITASYSIYSSTVSAYSRYEWADDVAPIVNGGTCNGCHYVNWTYSNIVNQLQSGGAPWNLCTSGYLVLAGAATSSLIYTKTTTSWTCGARMPDGGPYLSTTDQKKILSWIEDGAPNN